MSKKEKNIFMLMNFFGALFVLMFAISVMVSNTTLAVCALIAFAFFLVLIHLFVKS